MKLSEILAQDAEAMYAVTDALFGLVDDLEWKPPSGENWMTTGQLLRHCAEACGKPMQWFIAGDMGAADGSESAESGAEPPQLPKAEDLPTVDSVEAARRLLAEDRALCLDGLSGLTDDRLANERSAPPWGGPERTLFQHLNEMIWHLGQHKGQLFYYLKLQGKPVNTMHLWMGGE